MTILNEGANRIRDLIKSDMDNGQAGTGTASVTVSDTGLGTAVAATNVALNNKNVSDESLTVVHIITTSLGNSSDLTEYEVRGNSNTDSYNRTVKTATSKTSRIELQIIHTFRIIIIIN